MNGHEYEGRNLVVEIARPKEPKPERSQRIDDSAAPGEQDGAEKPKTSKKPKKQQRRKQQQRKAAADNQAEGAADQADAAAPSQGQAQPESKPEDDANGEKKSSSKKKSQRKRQAARQPSKPLGEPLTDSVFVDNLPFRHFQGEDQPKIPYRDEQLKELFESKGIEVDQVRVVNRSNPVTKRSRGLGFVQLKNSADQDKAISELNGAVVGRRTITVKVAKQRLDGDKEEGSGSQSNEQPAAPTESNEKKE